jgi:hypothetical protein
MKHLSHLLVLFATILPGCATAPPIPPAPPPATANRPAAPQPSGDFTTLQWSRILGLDRNREDLGYRERRFRPCDFGGDARGGECTQRHFSTVFFRLRCRDSDGTVEYVSMSELSPVISNHVRWWLGDDTGVVETDREGYGQVFALNEASPRARRLMIKIGTLSLGITAEDARDIIVPRDWCDAAH